MTHINPDDPKWTAYIFGELDEAERAAVELELEVSDEARMLVEELRFAADLTKTELREAVIVTPLTPGERERIRECARAGRPRRWLGVRTPIWAGGFAAASAAMIVLAIALAPSTHENPNAMLALPAFDAGSVALKSEIPQPAAVPDPVQQASPKEFELRYEHSAVSQAAAIRDETKDIDAATAKTEAAELPALALNIPAAEPIPAAIPTNLAAPTPPTTGLFGRVQDASAAVIPGVEITATNTETGMMMATVTNETGAYVLDGLKPGNYKLTGSLPGFQTQLADGIQLEPNAQTKRDMTLQVANVAQSAAVSATADMGLSTSAAGVVGGALGQVRRQAFAAAAPPPPASSVVISRAPGVPPEFDRVRPRIYNGAESYDAITDNAFLMVAQNPLSTFSIDVDTASYSIVRRYLNENRMPPRDAVRIEEMINYFPYDYPQPAGNNPVGASIEATSAPWNPQHRLVRVGIKARDIEARSRPASNKVLVDQMSGTMVTVAKDVKVQVEFNPAVVDAYRLIGYEDRALRNEDFNNDLKDAGDMGAGHTVTVLYEVVPRGVPINAGGVDPLKYQQQPAPPPPRNASDEMLTLEVRYKEPSGSDSKLLSFPLVDRGQTFARSSVDVRFAAAVASFGMILRDSPYKGTSTIDSVLSIAEDGLGSDRNGYRREFLQLVQRVRQLRRDR